MDKFLETLKGLLQKGNALLGKLPLKNLAETLKGLLQKGNELLGKLPFKGLAEKYIPESAKTKVPFLETIVTPYANQIVAGLAALLLVTAVGGSGGGGGSGSSLKGSTWEGGKKMYIDGRALLTNYSGPLIDMRQTTYSFASNTVKRTYSDFNSQGKNIDQSSITGTYIVDGNNVFMTFDGYITEGTIEGSKLTIGSSVYNGDIVFKPGKSSGITISDLVGPITNKQTSNSETDYKVRLTDDNAGVVITEYTGTASRVNIPAKIQGLPVREIGRAFYDNEVVTSVVIPEGVTEIGGSAFSGCSNLSSVTLPSTVTSIGGYAFNDCKALTSIKLPAGLKELGGDAFSDSGLTSFPNPWPQAIIEIPGSAFSKTNISGALVIPEGITKIGGGAFLSTNITSLTLPSTIRDIDYGYAFSNCSSLTTVNIPETVTSVIIHSSSFASCSNINLASQARLKELGYTGF